MPSSIIALLNNAQQLAKELAAERDANLERAKKAEAKFSDLKINSEGDIARLTTERARLIQIAEKAERRGGRDGALMASDADARAAQALSDAEAAARRAEAVADELAAMRAAADDLREDVEFLIGVYPQQRVRMQMELNQFRKGRGA